MNQKIQSLLDQQLSSWEMAKNNYAALQLVRTKELDVNGCRYKVQFNPARIVSSAAKVDTLTIRERACFLCRENRPVAQQGISFKGAYDLLVNPFPIFPRHLTVPAGCHTEQRISGRFGDMLDLADYANEYVIFYNGPRCGASAPDHLHFQAGNKGFLPIEKEWVSKKAGIITICGNATLLYLDDAPRNTLVIESTDRDDAIHLFERLYKAMEVVSGENNTAKHDEEPMMNIVMWKDRERWIVCIFPRAKHRPSCYNADGDANLLISPASVDMGGVFITPLEKDFRKISATDIAAILEEVCLSPEAFRELKKQIQRESGEETPYVQVGILSGRQIGFTLLNPYRINGETATGETIVCGKQIVTYNAGHIRWNDRNYTELFFEPIHKETDSFELEDVTIGINFHWERKENQRFSGALKLIVENEKLTAINVVDVEDYLTSVISSEMSATASLELLKAHAVISRSWLLAQIEKGKDNTGIEAEQVSAKTTAVSTDDTLIRWYDREAHTYFDVCADDHCQRYQGITRASTPIVTQAVRDTRGQVLLQDGKICDTRFSKCCGGALEEFRYCWEDADYPYLVRQRDSKSCTTLPDLRMEAEAERWIRTSPEAFCHTTDSKIRSQVLNNYDQETTNFYRWKVEYSQEELSHIIKDRSGIDFGQIVDLIPLARGTSGRIWKLKIVGTLRTMTIGKELEIRRTLSTSHLYSSAFVVDKAERSSGEIPGTPDSPSIPGIPARFILTGAGWGHGVGLCQIGAAVMGEQGYTYDAILMHYYGGNPAAGTPHRESRTKIITLY